MRGKLKWMSRIIVCLVAMTAVASIARAQQGFFTPEDVIKYSPDWHGERFPDGPATGWRSDGSLQGGP